jgi:LemA protein
MDRLAIPIAALAALVAAAVVIVLLYNLLVRRRILVQEGFSGIDVQLKRRHSLVPNLVATVEGYAGFEKNVLADVTRLRSRAMGDQAVRDVERDENALSDALKTLLVVAEAYPDLKANAGFLGLQAELTEIEDVIQKARRYYNGAVREYNTAVESFPGNLVAGLFGFRPSEFFELESLAERQPPQVQLKQGGEH